MRRNWYKPEPATPQIREEVGPREPTDEERQQWFKSAGLYRAETEPPKNAEEIRQKIRSRDFLRWRRLCKDFAWAQKQAEKMGINPEDVRWVL